MPDRALGDMYLAVANPRRNRKGLLVATLQVWRKAEPTDLVEHEWPNAELSKEDVQQEIAAELVQMGFRDADDILQRAITEAVHTLETGGRSNPFEHEKNAPLARKALDILNHKARWINAPTGTYYLNGTTDVPVRIEGVEMSRLVWSRLNINPSDDFSRYFRHFMHLHALTNGEKVEMQQFAFYDRDRNVVLVDCGGGRVLRLDGGEPKTIRNSQEGALFEQPAGHRPWKYVKNHGSPLRKFLEDFSFSDTHEHTPLSASEQRLMFLLWCLSVFFRSVQRVKPILLLTGHTRSGKSATGRIVGWIFIGRDFDMKLTTREKEDGFQAAVTNNFLFGYDNVDTRIPWLEDALCTAADGVYVTKRQLHTTNTEASYRPNCHIMITARTPTFRRPDVANRTVIAHMVPRQDVGMKDPGDDALELWVRKHRDQLMSEFVDRVNAALRVPEQDGSDSPIRSADFWAIAKRFSVAMGLEDQVRAIFTKLSVAQAKFATEQHPIIDVLKDWLEKPGPDKTPINAGRRCTTRELFRDCQEIASLQRKDLRAENEVSFGAQLKELMDAAKLHFNINRVDVRGGKQRMWTLTPLDWKGQDRLIQDS